MLMNLRDTNAYGIEVNQWMNYEIIGTADGNTAIKVVCGDNDPAPVIVIHDKNNSWDLKGYSYFAADITNTGKEEVLVEIRLNAHAWYKEGIVVPAGETKTVKVIIYQDQMPEYYKKKMIGMLGLPIGTIDIGEKTDSIRKVSFLVTDPSPKAQILISNLRAEGVISYPSEEEMEKDYFPLIDEFGQYRHTDWSLKTHNLEELRNSADEENEDLKNNPGPSEWNQYGGWQAGPKLKATGHFRVEKVEGKWWLVDPEGCLFWSHGVGSVCVNDGQAVLNEREFYFSNLPDRDKYSKFYEKRGWIAPFGYYKDREVENFNTVGWNAFNKYGEAWEAKSMALIPKRLKSWGQNTIAAWSSQEVLLNSKVPYTPILMPRSRSIEGSKGHWYKFPDPYDVSFVANIKERLQSMEQSMNDPYCIGYYVDNEMTWGDSTAIGRWATASPLDQPVKKELMLFLKRRYFSIDRLNEAWGTGFSSWEAFLENSEMLDIRNEDTQTFTQQVINEYFRRIRNTLKELAPNKLYLGPRLALHNYPAENNLGDWDFKDNWIVNTSAQYCDVVSFNRYRHSAEELRAGDYDVPVIIGEWHHVPLEKATFFMGPEHFEETLNMRAEKYLYFAKSCLNNNNIVGAQYFQYRDQATIGRVDGENFCCGFLNICDRPYPQMINASREIGRELYRGRYSGIVK